MLSKTDYTANELGSLASEFRGLRIELLCAVDEEGMHPMAEVEYLKSLAHFEQAYLCLKQAYYHHSKATEGGLK